MIALALWGAPAFAGTCGGLPASGPVGPGTYTFDPLCVHTLTGTLVVDGPVEIDGTGGRIEGDGTFRLIDVMTGDFTIRNVTLFDGGGADAAALYMQSEETFVVDRVAFYDNDSVGSGGALRFYADSAVITNSWFENNDAGSWGGAVWATYVATTFTMSDCVFVNNTSGDGRGQYSSGGYNTGSADLNGNFWNTGGEPAQPADIFLDGNAIPTAPITSWLSTEPLNVMHPFLGAADPDADGDGVPDTLDKCFGVNSTGDSDKDAVCNSDDACLGNDAQGDLDADGLCEDRDKCFGTDVTGDVDLDGICGDKDLCRGDDAEGDTDVDGVCDDVDLCLGDDATRDLDGDLVCGDQDVCAGDDSKGDTDGDGACDDRDLCAGDDATGDLDADGTCGDQDPCLGVDTSGDTDDDGVCEDRDWCLGDDATGNWDGDALCDDGDPLADLVSDGPYDAPSDAPFVVDAVAGVLANDTVVGGSIAVEVEPAHGALTLNADGSFTYTATDAAYFGPDWFVYAWSDDDDTLTATVTLYVGDAPADPIGAVGDVYTVPLDEALTVDAAAGVLANDLGEGLTVELLAGPATGALTLEEDGAFVYTPDTEEPIVEQFTYTATDGTDEVVGRVTIIVESRATPIDPWADVDGRCRCGPGSGGGGFGALALAIAAVIGRRRARA